MTLLADEWKKANRGTRQRIARTRSAITDRRSLRGDYDGSTQNRYLEDWLVADRAPHELTAQTLTILRQRSRDLARHAPAYISAIGAIVDNVVGQGFRVNPTPEPEGRTPRQNEDLAKRLADLWADWMAEADVDQRESLTMLDRTATQEYIEAGEVFLVQKPVPRGEESVWSVPLIYEVVPAEEIDHTLDEIPRTARVRGAAATGNRIESGIEFDANNRRAAYWISQLGALGEPTLVNRRITADRVHHVFHRTRARQQRGVPWIAGAAVLAHDLDDLMDSELTSAQVASCLTAWIQREQAGVFPTTQERADDQRPIHRFAPGMVFDLKPGETLNAIDPQRPTGAFEPFANFILRCLARTMGISFETISGDWRGVNFASGRLGHLTERRTFRRIQDVTIQLSIRPTYRTFVRTAILAGRLPGIDMNDYVQQWRRYTKATYGGSGWEHHDPLKEVSAAAMRILAGLSTLDDEAAALGRDWKAVIAQRTREIEAQREAGLPEITAVGGAMTGPMGGASPGQPAPRRNDDDEPDDEPDDDEDGPREREDRALERSIALTRRN